MGAKNGSKEASLWFSSNQGKRWTEALFLAYSPFWITWALCIVVPLRLYERCDEAGYMAIGLAAALPCVALPWALGGPERSKPLGQRYWVKANLWVALFSFVGNYFWTHYFYDLLGAVYTFPSWQLNGVPLPLYFMTHAYFCFYHALSNVVLRRVRRAVAGAQPPLAAAAFAAAVFALAYVTAFMETATIAHFPYYTFKDRGRMYTLGSLFYAIYFFVSFPAFLAMDEGPRERWSLARAAGDALGAGMLVTILLDAWRLGIGAIDGSGPQASTAVPWMRT
ncbi:hypothetical protein WJX81_004082 [Elliptochloris bilobata]|uniref:Cycloeucalenol cycloisomerase n=1 Tax=Elliptochloris bilobata TaxID=381761 RepID=A0AAW1RUQ9_9CHLO